MERMNSNKPNAPAGWVNPAVAALLAVFSALLLDELQELLCPVRLNKSGSSLSAPDTAASIAPHLDYRAGPQTYFRTMEATQATKVTLAKKIKAQLFAMVRVGS
jgi:hypothetical protein